MARTLAWPVRIEAGEYVTVDVGTVAEARQNVEVLSQTRPNERVAMGPMAPAYGTPDPVGLQGHDPQPLIDAARRWVPGATVQADRMPADRREFDQVVKVAI